MVMAKVSFVFVLTLLFVGVTFAESSSFCPPRLLLIHDGQLSILDAEGDRMPFTNFLDNHTDNDVIADISPSPSGNLFALIVEQDEQSQIYILNRHGQLETRLATCVGQCREIAWSPDETRLLYVDFTLHDYHWRVYLASQDGTSHEQILETDSFEDGQWVQAIWSPTGDRIAYELLIPLVQRKVMVYNVAEGTHHRLFADDAEGNYNLVGWRSSADALLFGTNAIEPNGLFQIRPHNGEITHLASIYASAMAVSPHGDEIAFLTVDRGYDDIYILDDATGNLRRITERGDIFLDGNARLLWSLDGTQLFFNALWRDHFYAHAIEINGKNLLPLTDTPSQVISFLPCDIQ